MQHPIISTLVWLLLATIAMCAELRGLVVSIADGDTITLLDNSNTQHKIRLYGIDAPERKQDYGTKARQTLAALVHNKTVKVDVLETDRYGRKVGKVYVGNMYVNLIMIATGMAWHYDQYAKKDTDLKDAQKSAKKSAIGLWSHPTPVPPWQWRQSKRQHPPTPTNPSSQQHSPTPPSYWVTTSSGKVHNSSCRYYHNSNGYPTTTPTGPNCKICGGTGK